MNSTPKRSNEDYAEEIKNLHAEVFSGMLSPLHVDKRIREILTEKDAEVEKALETKAMKVREEEANEYNKIIEKEVEKARTSLHASLVAAVEGIKADSKLHSSDKERCDEYISRNQVLTIINSIFKE